MVPRPKYSFPGMIDKKEGEFTNQTGGTVGPPFVPRGPQQLLVCNGIGFGTQTAPKLISIMKAEIPDDPNRILRILFNGG